MAGKVITRLELQEGNYNSGLAKAGRSLRQFQQQNMTLDGAMQSSMKSLLKLGAQYVSFGAAVAGAMKVANDSLKANESNVDEWGRTVEATKGIYDSFLQTLNNGDFSGFLARLDGVIKKAKDAYNAFDELQTRMTIINPERAKLQQRQTELKATIRREGKDSEAGKAAQEELKKLEPKLAESFKVESKLNYDAFIAKVNESLQNAGINLDKESYNFLIRSFSSDATYQRMKAGAKGELKTEYQYSDTTGDVTGSKRVDTRNTNQKLLDLFTDEWRRTYSPYLTASFNAIGQAASSMLGDARYLKPTTGGNGMSDKEKAEDTVSNALLDYQQSIEKAKMELQSGMATEADVKKATLNAQERLWEAYGKAYNTYADPKYKEAQDVAAKTIVELGGSVKAAVDAEKAAERSAKQLERANEKLAEARLELANAQASGNLKDIYAAQKKVTTSEAELKRLTSPATTSGDGNVVANTENLGAQISHLNEQLSEQQIGSAEFNQTQTNLADANALQNIISKQMEIGIPVDSSVTQQLFDQILNGDNISDRTWQDMVDTINAKLKEMELEPIQINFQNGNIEKLNRDAKTTTQEFIKAANAIGSVGGALQSIEDPAAKVAGIVAEAIANIAASFAASLKGTVTPWDWIAAATAGTAVMVSTIASIKSATAGSYAEGGFIKGGAGVGDSVPILANQGEYVMNQNELGAVAGMVESIRDNGGEDANMPYTTGEMIVLGVNNYGKRKGWGELTFSKRG